MFFAHAGSHAPVFDLALINSFLSLAFLAGSLFYLYRLFSAKILLRLNGYFDAENEVGHLLCLLAMTTSLAPAQFQIVPAPVWAAIFAAGTAWFALRARLWGKSKAWNKEWYDWAHAGMCFGMFWMYMPLSSHWLATALISCFWLWFAGYYVWLTYHDAVTRPNFMSLGQDIAHLAMGAVMFLMTVFPAAFLNHNHGGHHGHHAGAQQTASAQATGIQAAEPVVAAEVKVVTDKDFHNEVMKSQTPVLVLVFGGCENCNREVSAFQDLASGFCGQLKFVRINKDTAPEAVKALGVKQCPCVLLVKKGVIMPEQLTSSSDSAAVSSFIKRWLP